jgi:hypothetical protein
MAITLGAEVSLSLHLDEDITYADVEATLVDVGFTNYSIMRTQNSDESCDLQIYVRNSDYTPMAAADTLDKLTTAVTTLSTENPRSS